MHRSIDFGHRPEWPQYQNEHLAPPARGDSRFSSRAPYGGMRKRQPGYGIRPVRTQQHFSMASILVQNRYASRGYATDCDRQRLDDPNRLTLAGWLYGELVATLTVGRDSPSGLLADTLYASEVASLRQPDRIICEVSRLAVAPDFSSRELLARLFSAAYQHGKNLFAASDVVIEVNPRHAGYYQRVLGFRQLGGVRQCPRVDAPAVLLHQTLEEIAF